MDNAVQQLLGKEGDVAQRLGSPSRSRGTWRLAKSVSAVEALMAILGEPEASGCPAVVIPNREQWTGLGQPTGHPTFVMLAHSI